MKYFKIHACKEALEEILGTSITEANCSTEYVNNFCDDSFVPLLEKSENIQVAYFILY